MLNKLNMSTIKDVEQEYYECMRNLKQIISSRVKEQVCIEEEYQVAVKKLFFYFMYQYKKCKAEDFATLTWENAIITFHKDIILKLIDRVFYDDKNDILLIFDPNTNSIRNTENKITYQRNYVKESLANAHKSIYINILCDIFSYYDQSQNNNKTIADQYKTVLKELAIDCSIEQLDFIKEYIEEQKSLPPSKKTFINSKRKRKRRETNHGGGSKYAIQKM